VLAIRCHVLTSNLQSIDQALQNSSEGWIAPGLGFDSLRGNGDGHRSSREQPCDLCRTKGQVASQCKQQQPVLAAGQHSGEQHKKLLFSCFEKWISSQPDNSQAHSSSSPRGEDHGRVNRSPGTTNEYHDQNIGRGGQIVNDPSVMAVGLGDSRCPRRTCPATCSRHPAGTSHPSPAPEAPRAAAGGRVVGGLLDPRPPQLVLGTTRDRSMTSSWLLADIEYIRSTDANRHSQNS